MDNKKYIDTLIKKLDRINQYLPKFENNAVNAEKCIINILKRYNVMKQNEKYNPYIINFKLDDLSKLTCFIQNRDRLKLEQQIVMLSIEELQTKNKNDTLRDKCSEELFEEIDDIDDLYKLFPNIF